MAFFLYKYPALMWSKAYKSRYCMYLIVHIVIIVNWMLYYEQDGFVITLANWLNGRLPVEQIEQLQCEIVIWGFGRLGNFIFHTHFPLLFHLPFTFTFTFKEINICK